MPLPAVLAGLISRLGIFAAESGGAAGASRGASWLSKATNALNKTPKATTAKTGGTKPPPLPGTKEVAGETAKTAGGKKSEAFADVVNNVLNGGNEKVSSPFDNQFIDAGGTGGGGSGGSSGNGKGDGGVMAVRIVAPLPIPVSLTGGGGKSGSSPSSESGGSSSTSGLLDKVKEAFNKTADTTAKGLQQGSRIVNNDFAGAFASLEMIPDPVKKVVLAFDDAAKTIVARTQELSGWNPKLTEASTTRDVRLMQADFREAQRSGDSYAKATNEYTNLEISLRDQFAPIKDGFANLIGSTLQIVNFLEKFSSVPVTLEAIGAVLDFISDYLSGDSDKIVDHLVALPERMANAILRRNKENDFDMKKVLENTINALNKRNQNPAPRQAANAPMGIGLIDG